MLSKSLLKKIKKARLLKDYKQEDIAEKLNVSVPTYSRFERGITKTNYDLIKEVCSILDIDLYELENNRDTVVEIINQEDEKELDFDAQVESLIDLLEKQKRTNHIILKKLRSLSIN